MGSRIFLIGTPSVMKTVRRICAPDFGHSGGKTSQFRAIRLPTGGAPVNVWMAPVRAGLAHSCRIERSDQATATLVPIQPGTGAASVVTAERSGEFGASKPK